MIYRKQKQLADGTLRVYPHYWYKFKRDGQVIRHNTKQSNKQTAVELEAAHRTRLARGEAGLVPGKVPTVAQFEPTFSKWVEADRADKPKTIAFYADCMKRLLSFPPLANARLNDIDHNLIERYKLEKHSLSVATRNRDLTTLHKLLKYAHTKKIIGWVPTIKKESGEEPRTFVLKQSDQAAYLAACPDPLKDVAALVLETGLRLGEALSLTWNDVTLAPSKGKKYGWLNVLEGKTKHARRSVSLTPTAVEILKRRKAVSTSPWIFPNEGETGPALVNSVGHQHARIRKKLKLDKGFVIHSLRHTALTRLGSAGVDVFTLRRIAGHASITTTQRYVHPSNDAMEAAFSRMEVPKGGHRVVPRSKSKSRKRPQVAVNKQRARSSAG